MKFKKAILISLLIFAVITTISTVNAIDNITVDADTVVDGEIEVPTEQLEINFNDDEKTCTFKVIDNRVYGYESVKYDYKIDGESYSGGDAMINYDHSLKYYKDGAHNLLIKESYSSTSLLFNVSFNIKNNVSLSSDINITHTKTINYKIDNGKIKTERYDTQLKEGWNTLTEYGLTANGDGRVNVLKVYYRPYVIQNIDVRNYTVIEPYADEGLFLFTKYDDEAYCLMTDEFEYNPEIIKLFDQVSWNGVYKYQYKTTVVVPTNVKKPIYTYKKVKSGYKWKYYKTKWHKTKIVTHKYKNGKLTVYNNNVAKVKKILNQNGKITKTVYTSKNTIVYMKYPVDYYKKVPTYKQKKILKGYKTVVVNKSKRVWTDAEGTLEDIYDRMYSY